MDRPEGRCANRTEAHATAWIDGRCPLCQNLGRWIERHAPEDQVSLLDFRSTAEADLPRSRSEHDRELWVRTEGRLHSGYDAVLELVARVPGGRLTARIGRLPVVSRIGGWLYRSIARHRPRSQRSPT